MKNLKKSKTNIAKPSLTGVGNQLPHQYIISDLIFAVRNKHEKSKKYLVLSEISIDKIGNIYNLNKFKHKHNYDFVVLDALTKDILFIAEIERIGKSKTNTIKKIKESLEHIPSLKEVFIISFDESGNIIFERKELKDKKLITVSTSSQSQLLEINLKKSLVSKNQ
jgi:hypothetical protein